MWHSQPTCDPPHFKVPWQADMLVRCDTVLGAGRVVAVCVLACVIPKIDQAELIRTAFFVVDGIGCESGSSPIRLPGVATKGLNLKQAEDAFQA